jgi:hypothetical protein
MVEMVEEPKRSKSTSELFYPFDLFDSFGPVIRVPEFTATVAMSRPVITFSLKA